MPLLLSIKHAPIGKPVGTMPDGALSKDQRQQITFNWQTAELDPAALIAHIESGKPVAVGQYKDGHRLGRNFQRSNVIMLDFDGETKEQSLEGKAIKWMDDQEWAALLNHPFIRKYAFAVIQSASSKPGRYKARVIFMLDTVITDPDEYAQISRWIVRQLPGADHTFDAGRFFYGGKPGRGADLVIPNNVLHLSPILAAIAEEKAAEEARRAEYVSQWESQGTPENLEDRVKDALRYIPAQMDYADWLRVLMALYDAFGDSGIAIAETWSPGYTGEIAAKFKSFKKGSGGAKVSIATLFFIAENYGYQPPSKIQNIGEILRENDSKNNYFNLQNSVENSANLEMISLPYVSDYQVADKGVTLIVSPTGTGKTELASRRINALGSGDKVGYIAHRVLLVGNASNRLGLENYQNITGGWDLGTFDRLGVCLNSLIKYKSLPTYNLLILDEIEQVLTSLADKTLQHNEPVNILTALEYLITHAKAVLCMDAYASEVTLNWLYSLRQDVKLVINQPETPKRPLTVWENDSKMLEHCDQRLAVADKPILIACGKSMSKKLYERYSAKIGANAIRVINSENSAAADTQDFVNHINDRLPALKLLIYSPSMGTGVDITTPVDSVYGIFGYQPHTAADMLQMVGRARKADQVNVTLPLAEAKTPRETNRNEIAERERQRAISAGRFVLDVLPDGNTEIIITPAQQRLSNLLADLFAQRNKSFNNLLKDFVTLANRSYAITSNHAAANKAIREELKAAAEVVAQREKSATLAADPISQEHYDRLVNTRQLDPEKHNPGYHRWQIERFYGQPITPDLYDFDDKGAGRGLVLAFGDLIGKGLEVAQRDKDDITNGVALHNRKYSSKFRLLRRALIKTLWGDKALGNLHNLHKYHVTPDQLAAGVAEFMSKYGDQLVLYERRKCHSDDPVNLVRWLLRRMGLELELIRNCADAGNYRVSKDSLNQMIRLYNTRKAAIAAAKEAAQDTAAASIAPQFAALAA